MASFGKKHIRFDSGSNYLKMIADKIKNGQPIDFKKSANEIITVTKDVKEFLDAVERKDMDAIQQLLVKAGMSSKKAEYLKLFNGKGFTDILKAQFTKESKGAKAASNTGPNERCSLYAIEMAFRNNGFRDKGEFLRVCGKGLSEINPAIDADWESTFYNTQKVVYEKLKGSKFDHYSRDDGFMIYIRKIAKAAGVKQVNNWNPADLWLVKDFASVKAEIDELAKTSFTLSMLNEVLKRLYADRRVVGISLKKVSKTAKVEEANVDDSVFDKGEHAFHVEKITIDLSWNDSKDTFSKTSTSVFLANKHINLYMQIKNNTGNLKFESTIKGVGAEARAGQAAIGVVLGMLKAAGVNFDNDSSKYPATLAEFKEKASIYAARAKAIKKFRVDTAENFEEVFYKGYEKYADSARSLLMQIDLLAELDKLTDVKLDDLMTEIAFLTLKIGGSFGPYLKVS